MIFFGLFAGEIWLISYWTENYNSILTEAKAFSPENMEQFNLKLEPQSDKLQNVLMSKTLRSKNKLITNINKSDLSQEDKAFLLLLLKNLTSDIVYNPYLQDDINQEAIKFMVDYPDSEYIPFIKQYIHYQLKASKLGLGFELFTGIGYYTENLFERYDNMLPLGLTLSANYNNYNLYLRHYFGFLTTNSVVTDNDGLLSGLSYWF